MENHNSFISNFKGIIKAISFLTIVAIVANGFKFYLKREDADFKKLPLFYKYTKENNVDILAIGSSHIYCGLNTEIFEEELDRNFYSLSTGSQKFSQTYYLLEEAIKYTSPQYVIVDMFSLFNSNTLNAHAKGRVGDSLRWSATKLRYIETHYKKEEMIEAFIPLLRYHTNWKNFEKNNENIINKDRELENYNKGFTPNFNVMSLERYNVELNSPSERYYQVGDGTFDEKEWEYFFKTIELARANNIEIILIKTPVVHYYGNFNNYVEKYYAQISKIADQYDLNYIDYNFLFGDLSISHKDFADFGHVNIEGANKISKHLVEFIKEIEIEEVTNENLVQNMAFQSNSERAEIERVQDSQYGEGIKIKKIYSDENYNALATLPKTSIKQNGGDNLSYTLTVIVKDIENIGEKNIRDIFTIYNGYKGNELYQYREIENIGDNYYRVKTTLMSNTGEYYDIRINSQLPQNKSVEIYDVKLEINTNIGGADEKDEK